MQPGMLGKADFGRNGRSVYHFQLLFVREKEGCGQNPFCTFFYYTTNLSICQEKLKKDCILQDSIIHYGWINPKEGYDESTQ